MNNLIVAICFLFGGLLEALLFAHAEWDRRAPRVFVSFCVLFASNVFILMLWLDRSLGKALFETSALGCVLLSGVFSTMTTYRLVFHPLVAFPGPFGARVTAFWLVKESIPDLKFYTQLQRLHDDYGDFVRIRPRELSIRHPDAVVDVHGPNRLGKGEFYDQGYPRNSLQMTRDKDYHRTQRKYWDKAFQFKALQEYSPLLKKHYCKLLSIFDHDANVGTPIDASKLLLDLFFDVVSDLTFGKSFDTLGTGQRNPIIGEFLLNQKAVGYLFLNLWVFYSIASLPLVQKRVKDWDMWYKKALNERKQLDRPLPDLYTYISRSEKFEVDGIQEAQLAVVAGADTNAITISNALSLLCQFPEYQEKLSKELRDIPIQDGIMEDQHLVDKPYLNAIIYETLRLYPPVPGGLQRVTPREGAQIAGRYVPGNMIVSTPTWAIQRDVRAFAQPNDFIPERWSSRPELILRREAFLAFGYGQYNCAGKPLAMLQLRMVLAMIVKRYHVSIPPDQEAEFQKFHRNQPDCFTLHLNPLPLMLKKRETVV